MTHPVHMNMLNLLPTTELGEGDLHVDIIETCMILASEQVSIATLRVVSTKYSIVLSH